MRCNLLSLRFVIVSLTCAFRILREVRLSEAVSTSSSSLSNVATVFTNLLTPNSLRGFVFTPILLMRSSTVSQVASASSSSALQSAIWLSLLSISAIPQPQIPSTTFAGSRGQESSESRVPSSSVSGQPKYFRNPAS